MQVKKQQLEPDMEHQTDSKLGKGYTNCVLLPWLFNFCAGNIVWNTSLGEAQARIKIAGKNINNPKYADDTTVMAESEEELKHLLMKVKEESGKTGLKLNIKKQRLCIGPITSW